MKQFIMNQKTQNTHSSNSRRTSFVDRVLNSGAAYMANFAVIRGNMPSTNSAFFQL